MDRTIELTGRKIENYCGLNSVSSKRFNPPGEFRYGIVICFRKSFWGVFFGGCLWRRFRFGTARGTATGMNSGFLNLSLLNVFFSSFCKVLYSFYFIYLFLNGWKMTSWADVGHGKLKAKALRYFSFPSLVLEERLSDWLVGISFHINLRSLCMCVLPTEVFLWQAV